MLTYVCSYTPKHCANEAFLLISILCELTVERALNCVHFIYVSTYCDNM